MQTNPAVEQNKHTKWSDSPWNQSSKKEKGLWLWKSWCLCCVIGGNQVNT